MFTTPFKRCFLFFALTALPALPVLAQYNLEFGVSTGAANYLGDMGGNELTRRDFVSDMKFSQTRASVGTYMRYRINSLFSVKANLTWLRLSGNDALSSNPARNARNLNFRNDVFELAAQGQYFFYTVNSYSNYRHINKFSLYAGLGAGVIYHNPKTQYENEWVALRGLETEGYAYKRLVAVVPVSAGFCYTINRKFRIGWELNWRTTFTDYIDDVSSNYVAHPENSLAGKLANRTDELSGIDPAFAENFTPGNKRGDASHNDSYLSTSVEFGYLFRGHSAAGKPRYPWVKERQDKFGSSGHRKSGRRPVRKIRLKW
ncbi:MAG: DUF6089 family protein [Bacteroidia bacterium]